MNWYKLAKHVSDQSHACVYCNQNLVPTDISKNPKHHYSWGINYTCNCQKSNIWTNSFRDIEELNHIIEGKPIESSLNGMCNDLFCPLCYSNIVPLKNGMMLDNQNNPIFFDSINDNLRAVINYDAYLQSIINNQNIENLLGDIVDSTDIAQNIDIVGCSSLKHNFGIISKGYSYEYEEGEYEPIYQWLINNKNKIPQEIRRKNETYE